MTNIHKRLLVFIIGLPLLVGVVVLFAEPHHVGFNLVAIIASAICTVEASLLIEKKQKGYRSELLRAALIGMLLPGVTWLVVVEALPPEAPVFTLITAISVIFATQVLRKNQADFDKVVGHITSLVTLIIYPGFFISFATRITTLPRATELLAAFFCIVFLNDSMAYATGMLFGRHSRKVLAVSPNKTLVGFAGGFLTSPLVVIVAEWLRPGLFPGGLPARIFFGVTVGAAAILGDLAESALKRGSLTKDSGQLIPGRGGLLDSADSVIFAAPLFYYLYLFVFL
ncbi:MAG: phosphatidate cytidylyltransferase [Spirochaeta sp.]|nr:phosphatidate cytidylyltransferase [Spirochaeta sp.]